MAASFSLPSRVASGYPWLTRRMRVPSNSSLSLNSLHHSAWPYALDQLVTDLSKQPPLREEKPGSASSSPSQREGRDHFEDTKARCKRDALMNVLDERECLWRHTQTSGRYHFIGFVSIWWFGVWEPAESGELLFWGVVCGEEGVLFRSQSQWCSGDHPVLKKKKKSLQAKEELQPLESSSQPHCAVLFPSLLEKYFVLATKCSTMSPVCLFNPVMDHPFPVLSTMFQTYYCPPGPSRAQSLSTQVHSFSCTVSGTL